MEMKILSCKKWIKLLGKLETHHKYDKWILRILIKDRLIKGKAVIAIILNIAFVNSTIEINKNLKKLIYISIYLNTFNKKNSMLVKTLRITHTSVELMSINILPYDDKKFKQL